MKKTALTILALSLTLFACKAEPAASPLANASASPTPTLIGSTATPAPTTSATPAPTTSASPAADASTSPAPTTSATPAVTLDTGTIPGGVTIPSGATGGCSSTEIETLKCVVAADANTGAAYNDFINDPNKAGCSLAATGAVVTFPQCKK